MDILSLIPYILTALGLIGSAATYLLVYKPNKATQVESARQSQIKTLIDESNLQVQIKKDLLEVEELYDKRLEAANAENEELRIKLRESRTDDKDQKHLIREYNRKIRRLANKLQLAFWEADSEGNLTHENGIWQKLFGLSKNEARGRGWRSVIEKNQLEEIEMLDSAAKADLSDEYTPQFTIIHGKTGEKIHVNAKYVHLIDRNDKIVKTFGVTFRLEIKDDKGKTKT